MADTKQGRDHWELERMLEGRCERCGSADCRPSDYIITDDGDMPIGTSCNACGYDTGMIAAGFPHYDRSFIAPGDPGSHDTPDDYI